MDGYNRLKGMYLENKEDNKHLIPIIKYLFSKEGMNEKYLNCEKTLDGMYQYITSKVKEFAINNVATVKDDDVFKLAFDYFNLTNDELGITTVKKIDDESRKQLELEV